MQYKIGYVPENILATDIQLHLVCKEVVLTLTHIFKKYKYTKKPVCYHQPMKCYIGLNKAPFPESDIM